MDIKVPPHSDEAEKSVVGSLLIDKDAVVEVIDVLRPEMFYDESRGEIFGSIRELYEERDPIDIVTVGDRLKGKKKLKQVGGLTSLTNLANSVPTAAHVVKYAKIVRENFIKRQMISLAADLSEMAFDDSADLRTMLDRAEQEVYALGQKNVQKGFVAVKDALAESFDRLDELHRSSGGIRGVPTGIKDLDDALAGLQENNLIILAARPGVGKTSLALNIAQYAAVEKKIPVGVFSLEMGNLELVDRLLVSQANIDAWKLKTGNLKDEDFGALSEAMGVLADAPIFIDDTPGQSILEMRTKARRLQSDAGIKLLVVDYLQLAVGDGKYDSRVQEVGAISQGLKNLARELKIPVIALSQLSRAVESRGEKVPQLSDLRESGSIEQDADVVMFLYREEDDNLEDYKLSIAKHRNGPLRIVDLKFRGDRIKFYGVDKSR